MQRSRLIMGLLAVLAAASCILGSCDFLPLDDPDYGIDIPQVEKPKVTSGEAELVKYPSLQKLGAHYCPLVFGDPITVGLCAYALGDVPSDTELIFRFQLPLYVENTNSFPLPAVELLTALSVFPGEDRKQLAAICVSFCEEGDVACLEQADGTCSSDEPEISTIDDFVDAALNFITLYIENTVAGEVPPELKVKLIPPNTNGVVLVTFDLAPEPLLEALEIAFTNHLEEVVDGEEVTIKIPYDVEGAIWFVVENFGRFGINYGPIEGEWVL
jgi:hypothetical protein